MWIFYTSEQQIGSWWNWSFKRIRDIWAERKSSNNNLQTTASNHYKCFKCTDHSSSFTIIMNKRIKKVNSCYMNDYIGICILSHSIKYNTN